MCGAIERPERAGGLGPPAQVSHFMRYLPWEARWVSLARPALTLPKGSATPQVSRPLGRSASAHARECCANRQLFGGVSCLLKGNRSIG